MSSPAYLHQPSRIHVFVLALCVTGCLAVALYPSRVPADQSIEAISRLLDSTVRRILWGAATGERASREP